MRFIVLIILMFVGLFCSSQKVFGLQKPEVTIKAEPIMVRDTILENRVAEMEERLYNMYLMYEYIRDQQVIREEEIIDIFEEKGIPWTEEGIDLYFAGRDKYKKKQI